jgi:ubiquitin thioesterase OTU1
MTNLTLKLKTKNGQHITTLAKDSTLRVLLEKITEITQIVDVSILKGFPPLPVDISAQIEQSLELCGIKNGETLIVEEKLISKEDKELAEKLQREAEDEILAKQLADDQITGSNGFLMKKVVPADNSCLFTSIGFTLSGKIDTENGTFMRQVIAQTVNDEKHLYNEGILGRPNDEYCAWILQTDSWGGAIEVSILSNYYGIGA